MRRYTLAVVLVAASLGLGARGGDQPEESAAPTPAKAEKLMGQQRYEEAAGVYARVVEAEPTNAVAWVRYGRALLEWGQLDRAIETLGRASTMEAVKARALFNLASAWAAKGDREKALGFLEQAAEAGFSNEGLIMNEQRLGGLQREARFVAAVEKVRKANDRPEYHALDFWVGDWEVYDHDGVLAGTNHIESAQRGTLIVEQWVGGGHQTGQSMNFWNPESKLWKQVWVDALGNVLTMEGSLTGGAMVFEGSMVARDGRPASLRRMVLTPMAQGRTRQTILTTADAGKTWSSAFDAMYVPKGQPFTAKDFPAGQVPGEKR